MANLEKYTLVSIDEQQGRLLISTKVQGKTPVTALVNGVARGSARVQKGQALITLDGPLTPPYSLAFQIPDPVIPLAKTPVPEADNSTPKPAV